MKDNLAFVIVLVGLLLLSARFLFGCFPEAKEVAAASGYEAQQMACVDRYADKASIDACRDKVKAAWASDAGKDASNDR